jgi:hypothetical protein
VLMSWQIVSKVYNAKLGGGTRKAIAVKLADWADHDGCRIYPSVQRIADETDTSVRTVQYTLRAFVTEGLLIKVREGGKGPGSTSEYLFDLKALAALPRSRQDAGKKGATAAPLRRRLWVQPTTNRVQPTASKGAPVAPELKREPPVEPERRTLSLTDDHHQVTLPPGWELPDEDRRWTLANIPGATDELITASAGVFWERGHDKPQTPQERSLAWRVWARRERDFQANASQQARTLPPRGIPPQVEVTALQQWCKGIGRGSGRWDDRIGPEPKSETDALTRIAALETLIAKTFRSTPPIEPSPSPPNEQRVAPCV